jgi:hypothetical protein
MPRYPGGTMSKLSRRLLGALRLLALALIALSLATPLLTEKAAWGLWPITYVPAALRCVLALAAAVLVLFGDRLRTPAWLDRLKLGSPWARLGLATLCAIPFYLLRVQHLRWGDAKVLVQAIPHPDFNLTYVWQAPLDVFLHAKGWALGNQLFGWPDPRPVYWILSTAAGVAFIWVLLGLAGWLGRNRAEQALIVGLVVTLGTMELFFGYIENYTFMTLGVLIYIWLALRAIRGETPLVWAAIALALANAFHPSTIILTLSLLYAGLLATRGGQRLDSEGNGLSSAADWRRPRSAWYTAASIIVPYVLVFAGVVVLMSSGGHGVDALVGVDAPGGGDRRWFVPLLHTTTKFEHYTMFSLGHFQDILNEQLLVAPAILPGLILIALFAWLRLPLRDPAFRLLALMAACYLLLTLTWNPDYGGQRDWDLFAPAAIPAAILLGYALPRALPEARALAGAGWALVAAQGFYLVAWIYQNTLPTGS